MILLKELMCWNMEDIHYLKPNSRISSANKIRESLGEEYLEKLLKWNKADWMLYQHFNKTFTQKIESFGRQRMENEVARLRAMNDKVRNQCLSEDQTTTFFRSVPLNKYRLKDKNDKLCQAMMRPERQY